MRIISKYFLVSLKKNFAYRVNGYLVILDTMMDILAIWLFWVSLLELELNLIGWTRQSLKLFMGYSLISSSIANLFVGEWDLQDHVLDGSLDGYLLKPCSAVLLILLERANFLRFLVSFPVGAVMVFAYAGQQPLLALWGMILCILASVMVQLIILAVYELCFWLQRVDGFADLLETVFSISKYPLAFFPHKIALFFTYIVPIAWIGTIPVEIITGKTIAWSVPAFLILSIGICSLVHILWQAGRRNYESAN